MAKINDHLSERLKKNDHPSKMALMARQSANGQLTSFSGLFSVSELSEFEKNKIESILTTYALDDDITSDLKTLLSITSEVKAINNQAALLHGERIKKAHSILTRYRDGAFTAWLIATYGNRQTPYNLMQYYEFCEAMPKTLRFRIETMPRQALYTLASREGPLDKKQIIVEEYNGESKVELLDKIRTEFPLNLNDKRKRNVGGSILSTLKKLFLEVEQHHSSFSHTHRRSIRDLLEQMQEFIQ